jgi:hypothetical protein
MLTAFDGSLTPNSTKYELLVAAIITLYFTGVSLYYAGAARWDERGGAAMLCAVSGVGFCAWYWAKMLATKQKWSVSDDVSSGDPWRRLSWQHRYVVGGVGLIGVLAAVVSAGSGLAK